MKADFLTRDGINNINEKREFIYYPVILSAEFETLGRFNIVVLSPDGLGSAFFTGWAKPGKFQRSWTLPINHKMGVWDVVVVFTPKGGGIDHKSLNGILTENTTPFLADKSIIQEEKAKESIPFKIVFPNKDVTIPYPYLWISGQAPNQFELKVREKVYITNPNKDNSFLIPIRAEYGTYSVIEIEGGKGTTGFKSSFSIFSIKGTLDSKVNKELLPATFTKSFEIIREDFSESPNIKTPNTDEVLYNWELPVEDHCSTKKFQLIRGWAELDSEIIIDGNIIPVIAKDNENETSLPNIGVFEYLHPIRIGLNELEIKITDKNENIARENRFIECDLGKYSFQPIKKQNVSKNKLITNKDNYILKGQITPLFQVKINGEDIEIDKNGFFNHTVQLPDVGVNEFEIRGIKNHNTLDEYSLIRNGDSKLNNIKYISHSQQNFLKRNNIETIQDFFNYYIETDLSNFDDLYQLQKYLGFLLLGKDNLALFSELEAFLISNISELKSIEEIISVDPSELIEQLNNLLKKLKIDNGGRNFKLGDSNRFQRTLDDLLLEYQEDYLT